MVIFLIATLLAHDQGEIFTKRQATLSMPSSSICEAVAEEVRSAWRKDFPHATISVECVKVMRMTGA